MELRQAISEYVNAIGNYLLGRDMDAVGGHERVYIARPGQNSIALGSPDPKRLAAAVEDARRQWVAKRKFFDNVIEPDLIDYAVFSIGAAEKRYMFLLDEARRRGVVVNPLTLQG